MSINNIQNLGSNFNSLSSFTGVNNQAPFSGCSGTNSSSGNSFQNTLGQTNFNGQQNNVGGLDQIAKPLQSVIQSLASVVESIVNTLNQSLGALFGNSTGAQSSTTPALGQAQDLEKGQVTNGTDLATGSGLASSTNRASNSSANSSTLDMLFNGANTILSIFMPVAGTILSAGKSIFGKIFG